jgi:hypothetical protein
MAIINGNIAAKLQFVWRRGNTCRRQLAVTSKDANNVITNIDLTGVQILWRIIKEDGAIAKTLNIGSGITITLPNLINIFFLVDMEAGCYETDFTLTFPNGDIVTYIAGTFKVI